MISLANLCEKIIDNNGGNIDLYTLEEQNKIMHFIKLGWIKICFNADDSRSYKLTYSGRKQILFDTYSDDLKKAMDTINNLLYES